MLDLPTIEALSREMRRLEVDRGGIPLMAPKGVVRAILVEDVPTKAANIIKQEALARGGDVATPWTAADFAAEAVDVIVIGNVVTLRSLVAKLYRQTVYNLPEFADALQDVLMKTVPGYLPVARQPGRQGLVVEETLDDLFGGRIPVARGRALARPSLAPPPGRPDFEWHFGRRTYLVGTLTLDATGTFEPLLARAEAMVAAGAAVLELAPGRAGGSQAGTQAPASILSDAIRALRERFPAPLLAVEAATPALVRAAAAAGADAVRTGDALLHDPGLREAIAQSGLLVTAVHPGMPPEEKDPLSDVARFCWNVLDVSTRDGVRAEQVLLDPGAGLGKTPAQDRECIRRLRELTSFGRPLVYTPPVAGGADAPAKGAAAVTLAIHNGADFIRGAGIPVLAAAARAADELIREPATSGAGR